MLAVNPRVKETVVCVSIVTGTVVPAGTLGFCSPRIAILILTGFEENRGKICVGEDGGAVLAVTGILAVLAVLAVTGILAELTDPPGIR